MEPVTRRVWIIEAEPRAGLKPIGIGWWGWQRPVHLLGYRIAAFETRTAARLALKDVKSSWPRARVVRCVIEYRPLQRSQPKGPA